MAAPFIWQGMDRASADVVQLYQLRLVQAAPAAALKRLGKLRLFVMAITARR
jgi:hypothetical protein